MYGLERSYGERLAAAAATLAITVAVGIALTLELLNSALPARSDRRDVTVISISEASEDREEARPAQDQAAAPRSAAKPALPPKRQIAIPPLPSPVTIAAPAVSPVSPSVQQGAVSDGPSSGDAAQVSAVSAPENSGTSGKGAAQGGAPDPRAEDRYAMAVYRKVAARIHVTPPMRDMGSYGTARVRLTIDMKGRLIDASLVASSGHAEIDRMAVAQARSAAPFPPRPQYSSWTQRSFVIPMTYRERR